MNSSEFYLWLNGYLEALESEGIEACKIKNIREKMSHVKKGQERIVFGSNTNPTQQLYHPPGTKSNDPFKSHFVGLVNVSFIKSKTMATCELSLPLIAT